MRALPAAASEVPGMADTKIGACARAITPVPEQEPAKELQLDLGDGVTMEFIYVKPGKFMMGGENEKESRFACVELPKHGVELTQGFYLGKYEVTQAQYQAAMGANPSRSTKGRLSGRQCFRTGRPPILYPA